MKTNQGFSLIELLVVVGIIGIIGAVSLPAYNDYVMRGKLAEGTSTLADGRIKMEQYFQDNRRYDSAAALAANGCPATLGWVTSTTYFTYSCSGLSTTTYTLTATGTNALSVPNWIYTIDQTNTKRTTQAATGWLPGGVAQTCWVIKKNSC